VDSIAWRLKAAGYRTVCVHPFSRAFYGRDQVMPNLGFDVFLDIADFSSAGQTTCYTLDARVVDKIDSVLRELGPKTFVFAITMGNHSPWQRLAPDSTTPDIEGQALEGYLAGLRMTDAALGDMADRLQEGWPDGLLAAFGDHQPSLSSRYSRPGLKGRATDYLVMRSQPGRAIQRDISAHELPRVVLQMSQERKQFFFEKKNQKTFVPLLHAAGETRDSA
jgi:phosphoglycerol transferase MdoB-like AlkP superfamily enzyme